MSKLRDTIEGICKSIEVEVLETIYPEDRSDADNNWKITEATEAILQAMRDTTIKVIDSFDGVPLKDSIKEQMLGDKETAEILVSMEASANTTLDVFKERLLKELGGGDND